jgi:hypothetical protein
MLLLIALSLRLLSFYSYSAFLKNKLLFIIQFIIIQYHIIGLVEVKFWTDNYIYVDSNNTEELESRLA